MDARKIKLIAAGIIVILLGIVIFQNSADTNVKILMATIEMPMALLLFLTFIVGIVVGWVITLMRSKSSKSKAGDDAEA
jgi:uncharacterized integral membrane protein